MSVRYKHSGPLSEEAFAALSRAANDRTPVTGLTHNFYRYPARFSPVFAAAAIELFSNPGDLVLDPYMGGATAIVEGVAAGRRLVGNDINSIAAFIARVKTTPLSGKETAAIRSWADREVPRFRYSLPASDVAKFIEPSKTRNLGIAKARFIKKAVAAALRAISELPTEHTRNFARCAVLRVAQWALDGRESHTPLAQFRKRLEVTTNEMLDALSELVDRARCAGGSAVILHGDAAALGEAAIFSKNGERASLVVTSPPYPGVHVLYHRWQVDGRRETPAPYWIAGCEDGEGGAFYNFADRRAPAANKYFAKSLSTLKSIRSIIADGALMIQLVAFNRAGDQLPRYLENMLLAGFAELSVGAGERIWRQVPGRKWHARQKGPTDSSHEVVLIHRAV